MVEARRQRQDRTARSPREAEEQRPPRAEDIAAAAAEAPAFIPPQIAAAAAIIAPASAVALDVPIEVVLPTGYRLRLSAAVTPDLLQTVVTVLAAPR